MPQSITVPDLGDFHDVEVIDVLVKPGDKIEVDTPLLTIETEKATMDVPSTGAGVVQSVALKKGDKVSKGSVILALDAVAEAKAEAPAAPAPSPRHPPQSNRLPLPLRSMKLLSPALMRARRFAGSPANSAWIWGASRARA